MVASLCVVATSPPRTSTYLSFLTDFPFVGSNFLGPGTFPESFPSATPATPNLAEFTQGPPPISYQSDIPSSLLTPDKSAPCLPGQVGAVYRGPWVGVLKVSMNYFNKFFLHPQMAPAGHLDPAHNPGPPGLHTPNLGPTPGTQLHHPNPSPASRQPLGQPNTGPISELAFNPATGMMGPPSMTGAGEASEPALDVSNQSRGGGEAIGPWVYTPGFIEGMTANLQEGLSRKGSCSTQVGYLE